MRLAARRRCWRWRRAASPGRAPRRRPLPRPRRLPGLPRPARRRSRRHAPSLPNEAAWNQDISKAPVARNSAATIAYIDAHGGDLLHPDFGSPRAYGFPYAVVGAGQRKLPIHYTAYGERERPGAVPDPQAARRSRAATAATATATCSSSTAPAACSTSSTAPSSSAAAAHWNADSGASWDLRSTARRPDSWTSADAAGLPIFPGLVRYDEVAAGHIDHAIRVTFDSTRDAWVHPASHCAGDTSDPDAPAMGTRLRLKAGYGLGGFSGGARTIAEALKHYGMIVADNGSNWYFSGSSDRRWDDENLDQLKRIPGSAFQVVQERRPPARLLSLACERLAAATTWWNSARRRRSSSALGRLVRLVRPSPLTSTTSVAG